MNILDFLSPKINPRLVEALECNHNNSAILLTALIQHKVNNFDVESFIVTRTELEKITGLSTKNQRKAETYLLNKNLIDKKVVRNMNACEYTLNYDEVEKLIYIPVPASLVRTFKGNANAVILLIFLIKYVYLYLPIEKGESFLLADDDLLRFTGLKEEALLDALNALAKLGLVEFDFKNDKYHFKINRQKIDSQLKMR